MALHQRRQKADAQAPLGSLHGFRQQKPHCVVCIPFVPVQFDHARYNWKSMHPASAHSSCAGGQEQAVKAAAVVEMGSKTELRCSQSRTFIGKSLQTSSQLSTIGFACKRTIVPV
jgi:hypothetical protein